MIDGKRKVTSIQEITGMEGDVITMQEIFAFRQTGVAEDVLVHNKSYHCRANDAGVQLG